MSTFLDNRYDLLEKIGDGGMATVYRAKDTLLDRFVAIKILHPQFNNDSTFVANFRREAQGVAKLSHPNIVNIYDVGCYEKQNYIVMEYVEGETLKDKISREGRLPVAQVVQISKEICSALEQAHLHNLVHCDIKPHNILINAKGHIKVTDFGIARVASSTTMTFDGSVVGSVHYFSPEQATGKAITTKSDVYSLGVLMYEMLTGQLPFTGETAVSIAIKHLNEPPIPIHDIVQGVPPVLEAIVMKALTKDPQQRPSSQEMLQELIRLQQNTGNNGAMSYNSPVEDPYATRIMTPNEQQQIIQAASANRVNVAGAGAVQENTAAPAVKEKGGSKYLSFKYIATVLLIIALGLGVGAFLSYGNFWSGKTIEVPSVVGMTQSQAEETLKAENLRVEIAETYDENVPAGKVVSQTPEAGKVVKENRLITIYVSKGAETFAMPNLVGMSETDATKQLQMMNLVVSRVDNVYADAPAGTVLKQSIAPNEDVSKGTQVALVISKGKENKKVKVANVIGVSVGEAANILSSQGLNVQANGTSGTVSAQSIDPGTEVDKGTTVILGVSGSTASEPAPEMGTKSSNSSKPAANTATSDNVEVPQRQKN